MTCTFVLAIASVPDALCYPPAGSDYMEHTTATIELQIYGPSGFYEIITATGPTTVSRSDQYDPGDGRIMIDTEIVLMNLVGTSSYVGPITVIESPSKASTGAIKQQAAGVDFPADSFFDVFIEIKSGLPFPLGTLHNDDPKNMTAVIYSIPPFGSTYESPEIIYLKDELENIVGAMLATRHKVEAPVHDVSISDVTPSKTVVGQGYTVSINVTVENQGDFLEWFGIVAPYFDSVVVPTSVQWETFWSMGDCSRDGYIDQTDLHILEDNWLWHGPPGENPADINSDGVVNNVDLGILGSNLGKDIWTHFGLPVPPKGTQRGVRLHSGNQNTLTFTWNTTEVAKGNYTISAVADTVPGETDTEDNNFTDGWVFVTIPGDVNGDPYVNIKDAVLLNGAFGAVHITDPSDPRYCQYWRGNEGPFSPNVDINGDGYINIKDAVLQGAHFGEHW